ncbi:MAG: M20/M25/M40 family metallo-hydrolase [Thermoleophilia bacterium]|nr:M20/M25/M40 family metallo-hydrolase [Thermoleophilia bacterium]
MATVDDDLLLSQRARQLLAWIDEHEQDYVDFLADFLRVRSVWGDGKHLTTAAEMVAGALQDVGVPARLTRCGTDGMKNVQALYGPATDDGLIFNGHMEVYPPSTSWTRDPFCGDVSEGRIYGVGVSDMKSGTAAMAMAVTALAATGVSPERGITLLTVPNHYEGGEGTRQALRDGLKARYAINGEPSDLMVLLGQRGIAYVQARVRGRASHTAALDIGVNAIDRASRFVREVLDMPITGLDGSVLDAQKICNVAQISGGVAHNLVPEMCDVTFDFRFPPEQDQDCVLRDVRAAAERALPDLDEFPVEIALEHTCVKNPRSSLRIPEDARIITTLSRAHEQMARTPAHSGCHNAWPDTPIFWEAGIEAATYGPGSMDCYWDDESVVVADYLAAIRTYALAALELAC